MRFPKAMLWLIAVFTGIFGNAAYGSDCRDVEFEAKSFTVCTVQASEDLRLFLGGPDGPYASFWSLDRALQKQGQKLGFAMNAGMFHRDLSPVGLYVEHGAQNARIITSDGPGNFGLLPNGVFCIADDDFAVVETLRFQATQRKCNYATQSGPMLVIDGVLHQKFIATSDSLNIRNGVGVRDDGQTALFVISNDRVNFHEFARFFKDALMAQSALYLDGSISRLYAPMIARHDGGFPMGPIVGTVVPQD
jgi:uncharacterized protein YigE (DUF2233 family)